MPLIQYKPCYCIYLTTEAVTMLTGFPRTRWLRRLFSESYAARISVKTSQICEFRVIMGIMLGCTLGVWLHHSPCSLGCWTNNTLAARSLSPKWSPCSDCHHYSPLLASRNFICIFVDLLIDGWQSSSAALMMICHQYHWLLISASFRKSHAINTFDWMQRIKSPFFELHTFHLFHTWTSCCSV